MISTTWTQEQYLRTLKWIEAQKNVLSRSDWQVLRVAQMLCDKPVPIEDLAVRWEKVTVNEDEQQQLEIDGQKAALVAFTGGKVEHRTVTRTEARAKGWLVDGK